MKATTLAKIYTMLQMRRSQNGFEWSKENEKALKEEYAIVLMGKPDEFGMALTAIIPKRFRWRPDPCDIEDLYLEYCGLDKDIAGQFSDILKLRERFGPYAKPHPSIPGYFIEGPPSEIEDRPGLAQIIKRMGGWSEFCSEDNMTTLKRNFTEAHRGVTEAARRHPEILEPKIAPKLTGAEQKRLGGPINE